ncbi:MAG: alpha/beta fold hydrolase, partial [Phreatobacter sp.]
MNEPISGSNLNVSQRGIVAGAASVLCDGVASRRSIGPTQTIPSAPNGDSKMSSGFIKTKDGTDIFFKDWGPKNSQPIVFHHGWPLSSDDWDTQMLFFLQHGYRVVA